MLKRIFLRTMTACKTAHSKSTIKTCWIKTRLRKKPSN